MKIYFIEIQAFLCTLVKILCFDRYQQNCITLKRKYYCLYVFYLHVLKTILLQKCKKSQKKHSYKKNFLQEGEVLILMQIYDIHFKDFTLEGTLGC